MIFLNQLKTFRKNLIAKTTSKASTSDLSRKISYRNKSQMNIFTFERLKFC